MYFNGIDFDAYFRILAIRRDILPKIKPNLMELEGRDGSVEIKESKFEESNIEVDIKIDFDLEDNLGKRNKIRGIASKLFTREVKELKFKDEPDKYYFAKISGETSLDEIYFSGKATLVFVAPDPIAYGQLKEIYWSASSKLQFNLEGSFAVKPKLNFEIGFSFENLEIRNEKTGKYIKINRSFSAGDSLEIDFNDKWKARLNGVVIAEYVTIESDFFNLNLGQNTLSKSPNGFSGTMKYRERWI